jgi:hypothetical protein
MGPPMKIGAWVSSPSSRLVDRATLCRLCSNLRSWLVYCYLLPLPGIESQFPSHPACSLTIEMSCCIVYFVAWVMECTAEEAEPVITAIQIRVYWLHESLMIILGIYELIATQNVRCNHGVLSCLKSLVCQWFIVNMWSINVSCWLFSIK